MTHPEDLTPEEAAAEAHLAGYLAAVVGPGFTADDAHALEALLHAPPPPRVVELVRTEAGRRSTGERNDSTPSQVATPGAGLGALTRADRKELLRLTRANSADTSQNVETLAALGALYDKTRATPEELAHTRTHRGWGEVPTWTEWAEAEGLNADTVEYGHARVTGGYVSVLRDKRGLRLRDQSFTLWNADLLEQVFSLFDAVRKREAPVRRSLRQGTNFLDGITHGALSASKDTKRKREERTEIVSDASLEALALFHYSPLTWAERLAVTALANIALAEKRLDESPSALSSRPMADAPQPRIRIPFPGYAELAKWCGASPREDGRMPRGLTKALKHALEGLTTSARWITQPVLSLEGGQLEPRYMVTQAQWVELTTVYPTGETVMDLHPAAVGSILRSYVERAPDLYDRHEAARMAIGAREMRNEWSILEDYLLRRAQVKAGDAFTQSLPEIARKGKAKREARAAAKLTDGGGAEGERTVTFDVARAHLWALLELDAVAKKRGRRAALDREREAFAFCKATGTLLELAERPGKYGDTVFVCTLPHPDRRHYDPAQLTMLPAGSGVETGAE